MKIPKRAAKLGMTSLASSKRAGQVAQRQDAGHAVIMRTGQRSHTRSIQRHSALWEC